jgi:hypothetical protein
MLKKTLQIAIALFLIGNSLFAQQWTGSPDINGITYRNGSVGIGTSGTAAKLDVRTSGASGADQYALYLKNPSSASYAAVEMNLGSGSNSFSTIHAQRNNLTNGSALIFSTSDASETSQPRMVLNDAGKVGIGTLEPWAKLDIRTSGVSGSDNDALNIKNPSSSAYAAVTLTMGSGSNSFSTIQAQRNNLTNGSVLIFNTTNASETLQPRMVINDDGNIGIGTLQPGSFKLAVEGKIGAREIQVTLANPFPDYVFDSKYKLRSLYNLENYISQNKHLPGIPSAAEVEKNGGIELGQMNTKLLEKIEELTLYVIELNKKVEKLEKENVALKGK